MRINRAFLALLPAAMLAAGCSSPAAGPQVRTDRQAAYLKENASGYEWFANAADGYGGVPLVLLRSLPDLAPEIWGKPEEQFARFGYLPNPDGPLPLGLSWDSMDPAVKPGPLHPVALTCGACHIGRVTLDDGTAMTLVGGPNTQFDVRMWRKAFESIVHEYLGTPADVSATAARWATMIAGKPPDYFYRHARGVAAEVEAGERQYVAANAAAILTGFAGKILLSEQATNKQKATSYSKGNAPPLDGGSPGQSDGSGDLLPRLLLLDTVTSLGPAKTMEGSRACQFRALPDQLATFTDILSTWEQGNENVAQVDGSVKSPFFRNIAASLAVAGDPKLVNLRNAEMTAHFISQLPPPLYPFGIDAAAANRGKEIFAANCAACHRSFNDTVYKTDLIGTDPNRSRVLNADGLALFLRHFADAVPAGYEIDRRQRREVQAARHGAGRHPLRPQQGREPGLRHQRARRPLGARSVSAQRRGAHPLPPPGAVVAAGGVRARCRHLRQGEGWLRLGSGEAGRLSRGVSDRGHVRHLVGRCVAARARYQPDHRRDGTHHQKGLGWCRWRGRDTCPPGLVRRRKPGGAGGAAGIPEDAVAVGGASAAWHRDGEAPRWQGATTRSLKRI